MNGVGVPCIRVKRWRCASTVGPEYVDTFRRADCVVANPLFVGGGYEDEYLNFTSCEAESALFLFQQFIKFLIPQRVLCATSS
jgi:hypothetical protein